MNGYLKHDLLRGDSETAMEGSQNGFSTPPPGTITPAGLNGIGATSSSQVDPMEIDGFTNNPSGASMAVDYDDPQYKIWKQVTKKDRALVAAERHRLFKGDALNADEPALLRTKAGMRRWIRKQREGEAAGVLGKRKRDAADDGEAEASGETFAEGMETTEDKVLPDYYDTMSGMPDLEKRLQWTEDSEGFVAPFLEESLRIVPKGLFTEPESVFSKKMAANMRQMQETRKICTKIGVVKQMQLQSQV
jgi:transcriptional activator SPT7